MLSDPTLRSSLQHVSVCVCEAGRGRQSERWERVLVSMQRSSRVMLLLWACASESHDPVHLNMCVPVSLPLLPSKQ